MPPIVCRDKIKLIRYDDDIGFTYRFVRSTAKEWIEDGYREGALGLLYSFYRWKGKSKRTAVRQTVRDFNELVKEMGYEDYQISKYEIKL